LKEIQKALREMSISKISGTLDIEKVVMDRLLELGLAFLWESEETKRKINAYLISLGVDCVEAGYVFKSVVVAMYININEQSDWLLQGKMLNMKMNTARFNVDPCSPNYQVHFV
jgi:hypothetical protein